MLCIISLEIKKADILKCDTVSDFLYYTKIYNSGALIRECQLGAWRSSLTLF